MHPQIRLLRTYPQRDLIVDRGHAPQPMYRDNGSIHIAHLQEEKPSDISHASHSQGASSFHLCEAKAEIAKTSNQRTRLTGLSVGGYITCPRSGGARCNCWRMDSTKGATNDQEPTGFFVQGKAFDIGLPVCERERWYSCCGSCEWFLIKVRAGCWFH